MVEDWLANAYEGMSRRQFLARMRVAASATLAGFAVAANPVAGEVITTSTDGLAVADGKALSGDFQIPIYEARPATPGKYPVVLVIPEIFGMHEHIKDVTRRFAKEGFLGKAAIHPGVALALRHALEPARLDVSEAHESHRPRLRRPPAP